MANSIPTLSEQEAQALIATLNLRIGSDKAILCSVRNYCMALLMLDAGLRVGEVCKLPRTAIHFAGQPTRGVTVPAKISKTKVERTIPVTDRLFDAVQDMHLYWWIYDGAMPGQYAFYVKHPSKPITERQVERIIKHAGITAIGWSVNPHALRHTFATRLMRRVPIRVVQQLLGHKSLSSTQIYTHPNSLDLVKAIEQLNEENKKETR